MELTIIKHHNKYQANSNDSGRIYHRIFPNILFGSGDGFYTAYHKSDLLSFLVGDSGVRRFFKCYLSR